MRRIYAVGDIHGCYDKFSALLKEIPIDWSLDQIIILGDFIDRGPEPKRVVELLLDLKFDHPDAFTVLMGNHERMFLNYLEAPDENSNYLLFGGQTTVDDYTSISKGLSVPESHLRFLQSLPLMELTEKFCFVHAGLRPGIPIQEQKDEDLLLIRNDFIRSKYDWGRRVIFGHTPFDQPLLMENKIGIDTGAVYGGRLTCLILPDVDFIFV